MACFWQRSVIMLFSDRVPFRNRNALDFGLDEYLSGQPWAGTERSAGGDPASLGEIARQQI
jgi:hypothetical protein